MAVPNVRSAATARRLLFDEYASELKIRLDTYLSEIDAVLYEDGTHATDSKTSSPREPGSSLNPITAKRD